MIWCLDWLVFEVRNKNPGPRFTKGLRQKNYHNFKRKVLTVQEFCHKVKTSFCLDKMGFTKGLGQKFVLDFVIILRPLQGGLKSFLKYSFVCNYILHFVIPPKYILWGSILPKVISVDCNRNLNHLITCKFKHFTFLW